MTEEQVTKALIRWLRQQGWEILAFDFPQSGTGRALHPNDRASKTKDSIIPDIVAIKDGTVVDFEDKDRFVASDFNKVDGLRKSDDYSDDWALLLNGRQCYRILYGIGMPYSPSNFRKGETHSAMVDFIVYVRDGNDFTITDNIGGIFETGI